MHKSQPFLRRNAVIKSTALRRPDPNKKSALPKYDTIIQSKNKWTAFRLDLNSQDRPFRKRKFCQKNGQRSLLILIHKTGPLVRENSVQSNKGQHSVLILTQNLPSCPDLIYQNRQKNQPFLGRKFSQKNGQHFVLLLIQKISPFSGENSVKKMDSPDFTSQNWRQLSPKNGQHFVLIVMQRLSPFSRENSVRKIDSILS